MHVSVLLYEFRYVRVLFFLSILPGVLVCLCCVFIVLVFAHTAVNTAPVLTSWHLHNVSRWLCQPPVTTVSAHCAMRA